MGIEVARKLVDDILADRTLRGRDDAENIRKLKLEIGSDRKLDSDELAQVERLIMSPEVNRAYARGNVDPVSREIQSLFSSTRGLLNHQRDADQLQERLDNVQTFLERSFTYHDTQESQEQIEAGTWDWKPAAAEAKLADLQHAGKLGKVTYEGVPDGDEKLAAQYFLHKMAADGNGFNSENELVIPISRNRPDPRALYAIKIDDAGNATVKRVGDYRPAAAPSEWQGLTVRQAAAQLGQRFGVTIEAGEVQDWSKAELGILAGALARLSPAELQRVKDTVFVRRRYSNSDETTMGDHGTDSKGRTVVSVFQTAFDSDRLQYAGQGEPTSMRTMLHEIGHVLADNDQSRKLRQQYEELVDAQGKLDPDRDTKAYNALFAKGEQLKEDLEKAQDRPFNDFITTFADTPRLTNYARRSYGWGEYFAEAYSLYKLEPKTLQAEYPELFDYFNTGKHLK